MLFLMVILSVVLDLHTFDKPISATLLAIIWKLIAKNETNFQFHAIPPLNSSPPRLSLPFVWVLHFVCVLVLLHIHTICVCPIFPCKSYRSSIYSNTCIRAICEFVTCCEPYTIYTPFFYYHFICTNGGNAMISWLFPVTVCHINLIFFFPGYSCLVPLQIWSTSWYPTMWKDKWASSSSHPTREWRRIDYPRVMVVNGLNS